MPRYVLKNEEELHLLSSEICEEFVVRTAINDLLIVTENEDGRLCFQGFPQAENEEGTEVDRRLGWVKDLREIEWPVTFVGSSSGLFESSAATRGAVMTTEREKLIEEAERMLRDGEYRGGNVERNGMIRELLAALRTPPPVVGREAIARVLDKAGAQVGDCGHEPGEMDECGNGCRELMFRYADALLASGVFLSAGEHAAQVLEAFAAEVEPGPDVDPESVTTVYDPYDVAELARRRAREYREGTRG